MPKLSQATLGALPPEVRVPGYDRSRVTPGIVHIGVGNFHRVHQALVVEDLVARVVSAAETLAETGQLDASSVRVTFDGPDMLAEVDDDRARPVALRTVGERT